MMFLEPIQPDNGVLFVELTLFRYHCQKSKREINTIEKQQTMEHESIFPLASRCYRLIQTASERSFSKLKLGKLVKAVMNERSVINEGRLKDFMILNSEKDLPDSIDLNEVLDHWADVSKSPLVTGTVCPRAQNATKRHFCKLQSQVECLGSSRLLCISIENLVMQHQRMGLTEKGWQLFLTF